MSEHYLLLYMFALNYQKQSEKSEKLDFFNNIQLYNKCEGGNHGPNPYGFSEHDWNGIVLGNYSYLKLKNKNKIILRIIQSLFILIRDGFDYFGIVFIVFFVFIRLEAC